MRSILIFVLLAAALVVLAGVGVGLMISVANGRPNPVLIGVFAADSAAILVIAWCLIARRGQAPR
ncbi:MAG TPA: hypothetical protein PLU35_14005 [Phycisphaerales bacterium]|nr:hypothetical protein [Phycisphaerales bacterium]